jgi:diguanylate cyclase (GGDEF)-like protein/PAS domain S-box-containing protein
MESKQVKWLLYVLLSVSLIDSIDSIVAIFPEQLIDALIFTILALTIILYSVKHGQTRGGKEMAQMEHYMVTNKRMYDSLFHYNLDPVFSLDAQGQITSMNPAGERLTGYGQQELLAMNFMELVDRSNEGRLQEHFRRAISGEPQRMELTMISKNGERYQLLVNTVPIIIDNQNLGLIGIAKDVTEERMLEMKLRESEQRYRSLFEHNPDAIMSLDRRGRIVSMNPSTEWMSGYTRSELLNRSFMPLLPRDQHRKNIRRFIEVISGRSQNYETVAITKNGNRLILDVTSMPIWVNNEIVGIFCIIKNVTEHKKMEERMNYLAYHDALTELPNRSRFQECLERTLRKAAEKRTLAAILFLDLDRFKLVNDTLGHTVGDALLKKVAERLKANLPPGNIVSRQGGDEFLILLDTDSREVVTETAEKILQSLSASFILDEHEIYITPSIGIALYPNDGRTADVLLKKADRAMYQAKRQGKNTYQYYSSVLDTWSDQLEIERLMRKALEGKEFILLYQPKVDIADRKIRGVEALIRWEHPMLGMVPPSQFIRVAEESGLIVPLGEWTLRTACRQIKMWQDQGYEPFTISVNLSIRQFYQSNLVSMIDGILRETGLAAKYLELEITESMTMDIHKASNILHELKKLGVRIAIDDFGTGYSSLNYLKNLPIDSLKIDQSFIRDLPDNSSVKNIVAAMISMAHNLNLEVVAEGVETEAQLLFLKNNACDQGQGYLFSRPLSVEELESYIRDRE